MAAEALAEEVWNDPSKQQQIMDKKGAEALLEAINDKDTLLPALWALRNLAYNNETTKTKIGKRQGIEKLVKVCNDQGQKDPELLEAALSTLVNICVDHGPNCRRLLVQGLDMLVELAEAGAAAQDLSQQHEEKRG